MAEVEVGELTQTIEVEPLDRAGALLVLDMLVNEGHRVELYAGTRDGEEHYSFKVLVVEPIWGHELRALLDLADRLGRPLTFNETEGVRIR